MPASDATKLLLAFRSGDRCALPGCGINLTVDGILSEDKTIAEAAHIAGEKPKAARYNSNMTDTERNVYANLIYLCSTCHTKIDKQEKDYSVELLQKIKSEHEAKVKEIMIEGFANVTFVELQEATQWIEYLNSPPQTYDFSLTPLQDKIKKNSLNNNISVIIMALSVSRDVERYIQAVSQTDPGFPERLKNGFLMEYYRLKHLSYTGDDLFDAMCSFVQRGLKKQISKSAALALLVHLFEICEVFEK